MSSDEVLNNVRENMAIVIAMIKSKFAAMGRGSSAELWATAKVALDGAKKGLSREGGPASILAELEGILEDGASAQAREKEVLDLMTRCANLTKIELARIEKMGKFMTPEAMIANQKVVLSILKENVDAATLHKVANQLERVANGESLPGLTNWTA
jgi:hypothetical protein